MRVMFRKLSRWLRCRKAASAVEFAFIFPLFLAVLFGIITFGAYLVVVHSVQQIAAEAARAAIAGLSDSERATLAQSNINANVGSYPLLSSTRLTLTSAATDPSTSVFAVTLQYDGSDMFIFQLPSFVPAPSPTIVRSAAIQRGGY
ncbi:MAG: TadE/TadG family type IV pilus assembly protein [Pseudomonadota bacterium]